MTDTELSKEIDEQLWSYIDQCRMYEKIPSVLGYAHHLLEAYDE